MTFPLLYNQIFCKNNLNVNIVTTTQVTNCVPNILIHYSFFFFFQTISLFISTKLHFTHRQSVTHPPAYAMGRFGERLKTADDAAAPLRQQPPLLPREGWPPTACHSPQGPHSPPPRVPRTRSRCQGQRERKKKKKRAGFMSGNRPATSFQINIGFRS